MIIEKLRQSTAGIHKELDSWLMPLFRNVDNEEKYSKILKAFYGYYAPLMQRISVEIDTHYLPDFSHRRKADAILKDLDSINKKGDPIDHAGVLPHIRNASDAFGALYVLEGSTLGGVFLSRMLGDAMNINEHNGLSFFYGYGQRSREMWSRFIEQINLFAIEKGDEQAILSSARVTFQYFKDHLQQCFPYN